jgi:hypothetical protein
MPVMRLGRGNTGLSGMTVMVARPMRPPDKWAIYSPLFYYKVAGVPLFCQFR